MMRSFTRRQFLYKAAAAGVVAGLFAPLRALANWPGTLFSMSEFDGTLNELTQGRETHELAMLKVPRIAENGAQVRVSVDAAKVGGNVKKISLIVEKNPVPLTSQFVMHERSIPSIGINLKVRDTSRVVALVETDDGLYMDETEVQVTAGGCG